MNYLGGVIVICSFIVCIQGSQQTVGVRGTLMCGNKPLNNTVVKLWDIDTLDPDDEIGCVKTDSKGYFSISGTESEITSIDPVLKVYTDCNDRTLYGLSPKPCQRKISMTIPKSYINTGTTVQKWFNAGTLNMEAKQKDEGRNCAVFDLCDGIFGRK